MVIDISRPIHPAMGIYPGNPDVVFASYQKASADKSALTAITLGSHTGAHIDAPAHIHEGADGADSYSLDILVGPAEVVDVSAGEVITAADLPETSQERVLIKTVNSQKDIDTFDPSFVALDESAAAELVRRGVKLVGIDAPSIKKKGVKDRTHAILLDAGVVIVEGLWLADVAAGQYELMCLPLPVVGLDGAPVRAILRPL